LLAGSTEGGTHCGWVTLHMPLRVVVFDPQVDGFGPVTQPRGGGLELLEAFDLILARSAMGESEIISADCIRRVGSAGAARLIPPGSGGAVTDGVVNYFFGNRFCAASAFVTVCT
jgi:hypothetical protein